MRKWLAGLFLWLAFVVAPQPAHAQFGACLPAFCGPNHTVVGCTEYTAFIIRTSGVDVAHQTAYRDLICGLVTDGVWPLLDVLHVYATQNSATALINLPSATYNGVAHGAPAFTADRGYTGVAGSTLVFVDPIFTPDYTTQAYTLNGAHTSVWSVTDVAPTVDSGVLGATDAAVVFWNSVINLRFSDGKFNARVNSEASSAGAGVTVANTVGHFIANRSTSNDIQGYQNGLNILTTTSPSHAPNNSFYILAFNRGATANGAGNQLAMASIGGALDATKAGLFYARLRTYMTAVGVP